MTQPSRRPDLARADKVLPGLWRIRMPLPWPATPHGNAYAVAAGDGIVLFDTGYGGADGLRQLEFGLAQAGYELGDIKLIACTHAHADHFGAAASLIERTGAPIWIHPAWRHCHAGEDPDAVLDGRLDGARRNGVPEELIAAWDRERRGVPTGFDGPVTPDLELADGVEIETQLGVWRTHEALGHAPSHVVFHQPDRRLLLSGDAIVGRVFLYFDHGHTPDPVAEFIASLEMIGGLDVGLCVSGHGRPFREIPGRVAAYRAEIVHQLDGVRGHLSAEPKAAFEIVSETLGGEDPPVMAIGYMLEMTLSYLGHLEALGEAHRIPGDPERWRLAG